MMQRKGKINPLLSAPWVTIRIFRMDWLHIADLGVAADTAGNILKELMSRVPGNSKKEKCAFLYQELQEHYLENHVEDCFDCILPTFFEAEKGNAGYKLRGSAAKIRALVPWLHRMCIEMMDPAQPADAAMISCTYHLNEVYKALSSEHNDPTNAMKVHSVRFAAQYVALHDHFNPHDDRAWRIKPKMHLFMHITSDSSIPRLYWTYRDEDFGGSVARMARRRGGLLRCRATSRVCLQKFKISNPIIRVR